MTAANDAIRDHRACKLKHITAYAHDPPFAFSFQCTARQRISKAADWHKQYLPRIFAQTDHTRRWQSTKKL